MIYKQILAGNSFLYSVLRNSVHSRVENRKKEKERKFADDLTYKDVHDGRV